MRCLLVLLLLLFARGSADACDMAASPSRFEMFDLADAVLVGKPTVVPKRGKVTFTVETLLKGTSASTLTFATHGDCGPFFTANAPMIVFLKDGDVMFLYRGAIGAQGYLDRLAQWGAASTDAERVTVVAAAMNDGGPIAIDGVNELVNRRALVDALTATHIDSIAKAWPKLHAGLRVMLREVRHPALQKALGRASRRSNKRPTISR